MRASPDPKLPFRLALSHREKANAALSRADRAYAKGEVDEAHHANLRAGYERERKIADRAVERLMGAERARLESLEAQRRTALEEQLHLTERVAAGKLTARAANDENRRLTERLAQIDEMLASCRERLDARTSEQVGGFIDLPFEGYLRAETESITGSASRVSIESPRDNSRDWLIAMVIALVASLAVFLPWVTTGGGSLSLLGAGGVLTGFTSQGGPFRFLSQSAWILYVAVPYAGVFFGSRKGLSGGWGLLLVGVALLAGAVVPGLLVGTATVRPSAYADLLSMIHVGPIIYAACGVALVVQGAVRVSPANDSLRHATFVSVALAGALAGIALMVVFALYLLAAEVRVRFDATMDSSSRDRVLLTFRNEGTGTAQIYVPWPDAATTDRRARSGSAVGVRLYVKERGDDDFRLAPYSKAVWTAAGAPVTENASFDLNAGLTSQSVLDLRQLSVLGVDAETIRLQLTRADGELISEVDIPVGGRYLSPQPEDRQPTPSADLADRPSTPHTPSVRRETLLGQPPAAPPLYVAFTGTVGGQPVVRIYDHESSRVEDIVVAIGNELHSGWIVDSMSRQPASLTLTHSATGARVQLPRGEILDLSEALRSLPAGGREQ